MQNQYTNDAKKILCDLKDYGDSSSNSSMQIVLTLFEEAVSAFPETKEINPVVLFSFIHTTSSSLSLSTNQGNSLSLFTALLYAYETIFYYIKGAVIRDSFPSVTNVLITSFQFFHQELSKADSFEANLLESFQTRYFSTIAELIINDTFWSLSHHRQNVEDLISLLFTAALAGNGFPHFGHYSVLFGMHSRHAATNAIVRLLQNENKLKKYWLCKLAHQTLQKSKLLNTDHTQNNITWLECAEFLIPLLPSQLFFKKYIPIVLVMYEYHALKLSRRILRFFVSLFTLAGFCPFSSFDQFYHFFSSQFLTSFNPLTPHYDSDLEISESFLLAVSAILSNYKVSSNTDSSSTAPFYALLPSLVESILHMYQNPALKSLTPEITETLQNLTTIGILTYGMARESPSVTTNFLAVLFTGIETPTADSSFWKERFLVIQGFLSFLQNAHIPHLDTLLNPYLINLYRFRNHCMNQKNHVQAFLDAIDIIFGFAVKFCGPEEFFRHIPFQVDVRPGHDLPTSSWLLPILKKSLENTHLRFFVTFFLPLIKKLGQRVEENQSHELDCAAKNDQIVIDQIWALFPGFCIRPLDLVEGFPLVSGLLGHTLVNDNDCNKRVHICQGLVHIIESLSKTTNAFDVVASYSKKFLPVFFNVVLASPEAPTPLQNQGKQETLRAIEAYLSITPPSLLETFFQNVCAKLLKATSAGQDVNMYRENVRNIEHLVELSLCFVSHLDTSHSSQLFKAISPLLAGKRGGVHIQKKCYKLLNQLIHQQPEWCRKNLLFIQQAMDSPLQLSRGVVTGRLKVFSSVVKLLDIHSAAPLFEFITPILPEIIFATKEASKKSRECAYTLLVSIGTHARDCKRLEDFMHLPICLLAAQSPHMIAAAVISLARIVYQFSSNLDITMRKRLFQIMLKLLDSPSHEVVSSALSYFKACLFAYRGDDIIQNIHELSVKLSDLADESPSHYRIPSKLIFTKLLRIYGFEDIQEYVSETYRHVLSNLRKKMAHKKKKAKKLPMQRVEQLTSQKHTRFEAKASTAIDEADYITNNDNTDSDGDNDEFISQKKKLDTTKVKKKSDFFNYDDDGKMIVQDDDDDDGKEEDDGNNDIDENMGEQLEKLHKQFGLSEASKKALKNSAFSRLQRRKRKQHQAPHLSDGFSGKKFKSKKGDSDVVNKAIQPYAYLPLNPKKRKNNSSNDTRFNTIMKSQK